MGAGRAVQLAGRSRPRHVQARRTEAGGDDVGGEPRAREQQHVAQQVVEAASPATHHVDRRHPVEPSGHRVEQGGRQVQRQFQVGGVLVGRVAVHGGAPGPGHGQAVGIDRIEVSHHVGHG